jgi:hypothetical protein
VSWADFVAGLEGYPDHVTRPGGERVKTLAKYLDEYNWFEAVGRPRLAAQGLAEASP